MFETLSEKLEGIFKKLKGRGFLKEEDIISALKEIKMALLEADVNFKVVKDFTEKVRVKAIGKEVVESIKPGQQVVKIVHDELCSLMGGKQSKINPAPIRSTLPQPPLTPRKLHTTSTITHPWTPHYLNHHSPMDSTRPQPSLT
ncbi:MAG: signal recognition particle receptor subunit alpha, partial [Candidatus Mariimomonas ferrooxydans]